MNDQPYPAAASQRASTAAPPFNFSRRYACDRCRGHKLRCIRDQMSTDSPCQRCRKAREKCTIGSTIRSTPAQSRSNRLSMSNKLPSSTSSTSLTTSVTSMPPQQTWDTSLDEHGQNDALQLPSVPWIDILDARILDSTCDTNGELDFSVAGGGRATDDHNATEGGRIPMMTPTSQSTTTADHPFLSGPDDFEFTPPFDISVDQHMSRSEKEGTGVHINNQQVHGETSDASLGRTGSYSTASASRCEQAMSLDFGSQPAISITPPTSTCSSRQNSTSPGSGSHRSTAERKDACIQELTDLSSRLMKDLHRVVGCKLASSFLFTRSDKGPIEYLFKTLDGSMTQESAIGRMLQGSEKFLEIMQLFNEPPPQSASSCLENSMRGDPEFNLLCEPFDDSETSSEALLEKRWRMLESYIERRSGTSDPLSIGSWLGDSLTFGLPQKPDITFKLAVLTCYTCLLRIYETVFFVVHHTLECSPSLAPAIRLPQTVPGLEINGFLLHNHPSLQIRILIQVSTYMLDSVEKALSSMLTDPTFQILLKTVLQQEGLQCSPGNETGEYFSCSEFIITVADDPFYEIGMVSVRCLMGKVSKMLS